jgi:hypothetical protein
MRGHQMGTAVPQGGFNGNRQVNLFDFAFLATHWLGCGI